MATGSQIVLEVLKKHKVDTIFGIPGGAIMPLYDALYDSGIRHILTRHEQGAIHAADGYARASGKVGVCFATSGPGATNLVTGLATAMMDSVPLVAITGQVPTPFLGSDAFQEADIYGISIPVTKYNYLVKTPSKLAHVLEEAFLIARSGRPGPVLVDLPKDVQSAETEHTEVPTVALPAYAQVTRTNDASLAEALAAMEASERPVMYVGGGAISSGAAPEVVELAERATIPVTTTLMGIGAFPGNHPLSLGMLGMHGTKYANYAMNEADLVLALGARFDDRVTGKASAFVPKATIVHFDIDAAEIGKVKHAHIAVPGDLKRSLTSLLKRLENAKFKDRGPWLQQIDEWKRIHPLHYEQNDEGLKPQYVIEQIYEVTRGEALVTVGVGQHQMWAAQFYKFPGPNLFLSSSGLGTMGYGFPAALGAQLARPDKLVVCIDGDGSFQMNIQELATAVCYHIPVKVAIINNGYHGMVRQWQQIFYKSRYSESYLGSGNPDFVKVAEGYGARGLCITDPRDVRPSLEKAMEIDGPVLLDFRVLAEENVYPMIPSGGTIEQMIG